MGYLSSDYRRVHNRSQRTFVELMKPSEGASMGHSVIDGPPMHRAHYRNKGLWVDLKEDGHAKVGSPSMM
jgi:hypothetical protein